MTRRPQPSPLVPSGYNTDFICRVMQCRNALDMRVARALLGESKVIADRQKTAFQRGRVGNLVGCRVLHLIDEEDSGTNADPLKGFEKFDRPVAVAKFTECMSRLS